MARYVVEERSLSGGFKPCVIDKDRPEVVMFIGRGGMLKQRVPLCECYSQSDADRIVEALNLVDRADLWLESLIKQE